MCALGFPPHESERAVSDTPSISTFQTGLLEYVPLRPSCTPDSLLDFIGL